MTFHAICSWMKSRRGLFPIILVVLVILLIGVAIVLDVSGIRTYGTFLRLCMSAGNKSEARLLAAKLCRTRRGVQFALEDLDGMGGATRTWSTRILQYSPLEDYVVQELNGMAQDTGESLPRRTEALLILWRRTKDITHLAKAFALVHPASADYDVITARSLLAEELADKLLFTMISGSHRQELNLTEGEFYELLSNSRLLGGPGNDERYYEFIRAKEK